MQEFEEIKIIEKPITRLELKEIGKKWFGDFVKVVVDVDREIAALGGELHADEERILLEYGSQQENLWGINLLLEKDSDSWIEFDSMINIRPRQGNRSRGVDDPRIRERITALVKKLFAD